MSFWSTEKFEQNAATEKIVIPYDRNNLKHGAYELAVGPEAYITSAEVKELLENRQQMTVPSGQFGLIITEEVVCIPTTAIGFISIRASIKFQGLVNVSGFHVDPGFTGRLKFAIYNAGSRDIVLERGERIFMIWLSDLDQPTLDKYQGSREGQMGVAAADVRQLRGDIASPAALKKELQELRTDIEKKTSSIEKEILIWRAVGIALLIAVVGPWLRDALSHNSPGPSHPASVPSVSVSAPPTHPAISKNLQRISPSASKGGAVPPDLTPPDQSPQKRP